MTAAPREVRQPKIGDLLLRVFPEGPVPPGWTLLMRDGQRLGYRTMDGTETQAMIEGSYFVPHKVGLEITRLTL